MLCNTSRVSLKRRKDSPPYAIPYAVKIILPVFHFALQEIQILEDKLHHHCMSLEPYAVVSLPLGQDNSPNPPVNISLLESVQQHAQQEAPHSHYSDSHVWRKESPYSYIFLVPIAGHHQQLKQKHAFSA